MFDLDGFIAACRRVVGQPHAAKAVLGMMREALADPEAIAASIPPIPAGSTILDAPLFSSPEMTVLNVALRPHVLSIPHDHTVWAVIGIYEGEEANTFYRRSVEGIAEANHRTIHKGEALLLGADVVHAIENPLDRPTLGLHVYGGDLLGAERSMWDPATGREHPYDIPQFNRWSRDLALSRRQAAGAPS